MNFITRRKLQAFHAVIDSKPERFQILMQLLERACPQSPRAVIATHPSPLPPNAVPSVGLPFVQAFIGVMQRPHQIAVRAVHHTGGEGDALTIRQR